MTGPVPAAGPLSATLDGLPASGRVRVLSGVPDGEEGWRPATALHAPETLDELVAQVHAGVCRLVPPDRRHDVPPAVAPSYLLEWYLRAVASAAALPFVHARRVPRLDAADLTVRWSATGWPDAVALATPVFACLPDDADATHPDARPVEDAEALRARLRDEVGGHAEAFRVVWGRRGGRGRHAVRAIATDALAAALQDAAAGALGALVAATVLAPDPPRSVAPFVRLPGAAPLRRRASCCLAYAVPGAATCTTCPRLP